ncbi:MAG: penicillin-binding protein [Flavobacteriaceae bacterium]
MQNKKVSYRIFLVAFGILLLTIGIVFKLTKIQWAEGEYYRNLAEKNTIETFVIPANQGNIYSADGSLLAISIPNYTIRFDAVAPTNENFTQNINALADSLSLMFGKSSSFYKNELTKARANRNRYYLIGRNLNYTNYMRVKGFPLFNLGTYKGGMITEQKTVRQHPIGRIAERTIGYRRLNADSTFTNIGIEGAFQQYINGKDGKVVKQKMAKGQWKPINDNNEIEPQDGYDVISTIDVYIQDIAHHALLKQLEYYEADHGCVVVMEVKTGEIKAISNLGRQKNGTYAETINYAVWESQEPGSTFKLAALMALLEDKKVDTSKVYDTQGGEIIIHRRKVRDSKKGGYGKISLARGIEVSANTVIVQAVYESYKDNPAQFVDKLYAMHLNEPLGLPIQGEGKPVIYHPKHNKEHWSGLTLPWMAYGYNLQLTPLQTLTFYNAIANNGEMVKPQFVKEIKEWNKTVAKFDKEVINPKICSDETLKQIQDILKNVVERGTGRKLYSPNFSMAGKTGTAQVDYAVRDSMYYSSSFAGYFPADEPKYSCIVVVHKPSRSKGYYGADVSGPVFKAVAQKIFTDSPTHNEVKDLNQAHPKQEQNYQKYNNLVNNYKTTIPNVKGMPGMDAVALLENLGLKVKITGNGKVKSQSIPSGEKIVKNQTIVLELS